MIKFIRSSTAFRTLFVPGAAAGLAAAIALVPQGANAATGTITINGSVLGTTCSVTAATGGNNSSGFSSGNFTVTLPGVQKSALATAGSKAGNTPFSMTLSGCPTSPSGEQVAAYFSGSNVNAADGYLTNTTTTGGATNVEIQLLNGSGSSIDLSKPSAYAQGSSYATINTSGAANLSYEAQYIVPTGATGGATAGKVTTTVDYTLVYR